MLSKEAKIIRDFPFHLCPRRTASCKILIVASPCKNLKLSLCDRFIIAQAFLTLNPKQSFPAWVRELTDTSPHSCLSLLLNSKISLHCNYSSSSMSTIALVLVMELFRMYLSKVLKALLFFYQELQRALSSSSLFYSEHF